MCSWTPASCPSLRPHSGSRRPAPRRALGTPPAGYPLDAPPDSRARAARPLGREAMPLGLPFYIRADRPHRRLTATATAPPWDDAAKGARHRSFTKSGWASAVDGRRFPARCASALLARRVTVGLADADGWLPGRQPKLCVFSLRRRPPRTNCEHPRPSLARIARIAACPGRVSDDRELQLTRVGTCRRCCAQPSRG